MRGNSFAYRKKTRHTKSTMHDSFSALVKYLPVVLALSFAAAGVAYIIATNAPAVHEVHFSYMVSPIEREEATGFRYDGYYAISGTELFSSTLASLIASPEVIVRGYAIAGIALPSEDPIQLAGHVRAKKSAPQLVQVTVDDSSRSVAEQLSRGIMQATEDAVHEYNTTLSPSLAFTITATKPWTGTVRFAALPIAITTGVFALVVGCMIVLFIVALKRGQS